MAGGGSVPAAEDWLLRQTDFDQLLPWEGLFTLGSAGLHVRGCLEEPVGDDPQNRDFMRLPGNVTAEDFREGRQKWGTYVPGIYGRHPLLNAELINLPWLAGVKLRADGERLDLRDSQINRHCRELDLRHAILRRSLHWTTKSGAILQVEFERFVAAGSRLLMRRVRVASDRAVELEVEIEIDTDVRTNGYDHLVDRELFSDSEGLGANVVTDRGERIELRCKAVVAPLDGGVEDERGLRAISRRESRRVLSGEEQVFDSFCAVSTSRDKPGAPTADHSVSEALTQGYEKVRASHGATWEERWRRCDVEIDGPAEDQRALRVGLFHLLRSHPEDDRVAIEPKGYAGDAYFGRFFWDTEMCLLPFFLYTDPARARELLAFRKRTLDGARRNSARYGYPGARFAWESDDRGDENCAAWEYAEHEIHVTADVVYALTHHDANVPQAPLLPECAELLVETCRFWTARCDRRPRDAHHSLLGVMGPDEYAHFGDNNAYTNRMVKLALGLAAMELGEKGGASAEERAQFARLAAELPIPRSEVDPDLVLQCDGYDRRAESRFEQFWRDRARPYAAQVSQERLYRSQNLKQADVLLLQWLFAAEFSESEIRTAWDYYVPRTTHDSSLSAGTHAIVAARLGKLREAYDFWRQTSRLDLDGGAAQGVHIAAAGSTWMSAVFGFAGVATAFETSTLTLRPRLPVAWEGLRFPLIWRGAPVHVAVSRDRVIVENLGREALACEIAGRMLHVPPGGRGEHIVARRTTIAAVVFDLDGVIVSTDKYHAAAWQRLAGEEGIPLSEAQLERCRGVSRTESAAIVLELSPRRYTRERLHELAERKNGYYRESLALLSRADLLPGVEALLTDLRRGGVRVAIASSSRNAPFILERLGLAGCFDAVADGNDLSRSKPDPEVFLLAARRLGIAPVCCLAVEDATAGVLAAKAAGMRVIAVGAAQGHAEADRSLASLAGIDAAALLAGTETFSAVEASHLK